MWVDNVVVCLACAASFGCMQTIAETRSLPPSQETVLLPPAPGGGSALRLRFEREGDFIGGHVTWAATCRRALVAYPRSETRTRSVPNGPGAFAAGMAGVGAGTAGTLLLAHRDEFSAKQTCDVDCEGNETCSSPREDATAGGLALVGTGIALATASIVTLASKPTTTSIDVTRGPALPPRILEDGVACGDGAVAGLGLALYRENERVAAATTDEEGAVGFSVPGWSGEPLSLKVERVPSGSRTLARGQSLGNLHPHAKPPVPAW